MKKALLLVMMLTFGICLPAQSYQLCYSQKFDPEPVCITMDDLPAANEAAKLGRTNNPNHRYWVALTNNNKHHRSKNRVARVCYSYTTTSDKDTADDSDLLYDVIFYGAWVTEKKAVAAADRVATEYGRTCWVEYKHD